MEFQISDLRRIAQLARLKLTAEEESRLADELSRILGYIDSLGKVETTGIEPMAHASEIVNALREDRVTNAPDTDALLANAPATDATFFQVPKILE